jgi:hypothetical protein
MRSTFNAAVGGLGRWHRVAGCGARDDHAQRNSRLEEPLPPERPIGGTPMKPGMGASSLDAPWQQNRPTQAETWNSNTAPFGS